MPITWNYNNDYYTSSPIFFAGNGWGTSIDSSYYISTKSVTFIASGYFINNNTQIYIFVSSIHYNSTPITITYLSDVFTATIEDEPVTVNVGGGGEDCYVRITFPKEQYKDIELGDTWLGSYGVNITFNESETY